MSQFLAVKGSSVELESENWIGFISKIHHQGQLQWHIPGFILSETNPGVAFQSNSFRKLYLTFYGVYDVCSHFRP